MGVSNYRGQRLVSHTGGWVGYGAMYMRFSDLGLSFVTMCNVPSARPVERLLKIKDFYLDALGVPPKAE
jgi:hypothetical protein